MGELLTQTGPLRTSSEARRAEIPRAAVKPMRGRTKGNWGAGDRAVRLAPGTVVADSSLVLAIEDQPGQMGQGQTEAVAAVIASVAAMFLPEEAQRAAGLLAAALVD